MSLKEKIITYLIKRELDKKENQPMIQKLMGLWTLLEGKKSTWLAVISLVSLSGNIFGFVTAEQTEKILAICGTAYAGTMAEKINRLIATLKEVKGLSPIKS